MPRPHRLTTAAVLALALCLTGCTGTEPGDPQLDASAPTTATAESSSPTGAAVPPVDRPLNIDDFLRSPCAALTKQQIDAFLGPSATAKPDPAASTGPDCRWGTDMRHARIYVIFPRVSERGLAAVYQNHDEKYDFFREMPLAAGYPSVAYGVTDNRGEGECTVRVGVSDRDTVDITLYLSDNKVGQLDPCEAAHEVATAVVGNIKARN